MKLIRTLYLACALAAGTTGMMAQSQSPGYFLHTIAKGQSLYSIASMYHVSIDEIIRMNPGSEDKIRAGKTLKIPQKDTNQAAQVFHTIQPGETLYKLTLKYGVTAQNICRANPGLNERNFRIGQVICIPAPSKVEGTDIATQPKAEAPIVAPTPQKAEYQDMHKVKRKETIFSISREYGITEAELIAANPELRTEKLKKGKFLRIPYPTKKEETKVAETAKSDIIPTDNQLFVENKKEVKKLTTIQAAVMLPFHADGSGNRDEQTRMVEYYEGFLMAVDSLKERGVNIDLYTYDTKGNTATVKNLLAKSEMKQMDIIFGPSKAEQIKPVAEFAKEHDIRMVIPFTAKGEDVFTNPSVYQINTPQSYLYSEVYEHFTRKFTNANVIFLTDLDERTDKNDFIRGLKDELQAKGTSYTDVSCRDSVPTLALKDLFTADKDNILIPTTGTNLALVKALPQLIVTKRLCPEQSISLFGYPEWQTYTHDHLESFYELDTYFYSSFYTNNLFPEAVQFSAAYRKWYSKSMLNSYPKYGMLGFDTGYFFLKGLSQYGSTLEEKLDKMTVTPIQTGFKFERVNNWGGFINRKVFFVRFSPQFELIKLDFE